MGFGPEGGVVPEGRDLFQQELSDPCSGGAGEDGVLERFWFNSAAGAGQFRVLVEPGGMGSQIALARSHLVDSPCHKLP